MENKEYFEGLNFEGYYDEDKNFYINISKESAQKLIRRLTGAVWVNID